MTCERRSRLVTGAASFCPDWIYDLARFVDRAVLTWLEQLEGADCGLAHCFDFGVVGLTSGPHGLSESALLDRLEWSSAFAPSTILGTRIIGHCVSARRQIHRIGPLFTGPSLQSDIFSTCCARLKCWRSAAVPFVNEAVNAKPERVLT